MFPFTHPAARAIAAATLLATFVLGNPLTARSASPAAVPAAKSPGTHQMLAQASPPGPATTEAAPAAAKPDPVEARIKELHNRLHITTAQQTQWDSLVQVMRDNAKAMMDLQKQRATDVKTMTAVDAVKSYAAVIEAHEAGMAKFVPAFEALYNTMSDAQKKTADAMFRSRVKTASGKESK